MRSAPSPCCYPAPAGTQFRQLKSCQSLGRGVTIPCWLPFCSGYAVSAVCLLNQQLKMSLESRPLARRLRDAGRAAPLQGSHQAPAPRQAVASCGSKTLLGFLQSPAFPRYPLKRRHQNHTQHCSRAFALFHLQVTPAANCRRSRG